MVELALHEKDGYEVGQFHLERLKAKITYKENVPKCRKITGYGNGQINRGQTGTSVTHSELDYILSGNGKEEG